MNDEDDRRIHRNLLARRGSLYTQAILIEDYTSVHEKLSYRQQIRHFRLQIYNFLERPRGTFSFLYHIFIFACIILVHTFSALADMPEHDEWITPATLTLEMFLAFYLSMEFIVRVWSIGADAKYNGVYGIISYFRRIVVIFDIIILFVTYFMLFSHGDSFERTTIEKIRFLQILRLFHVDREMTTWAMFKKMISRSFEELITIYWMCALIFLIMAVSIYELESAYEAGIKRKNETTTPTFDNYGQSFWFSVITVLTVGYGDIVPKYWVSKIVLSILAVMGVCMFGAASSLVGVGMSLMVENEAKIQQKNKVRNLAARLIQTWYRFSLISDVKRFSEFTVFRKFCNNLHFVEERMKQARMIAKRAAGRKKSRAIRIGQSLRRTGSFQERHSTSYADSAAELGLAALIHHSPIINVDPSASNRLQEIISARNKFGHDRKASTLSPASAELPPKPPNWRRSSTPKLPHQPNSIASAPDHHPSLGQIMSRENSLLTNSFASDSSMASVDFSDEEKLLDYYYDPYKGESNSLNSIGKKSADTNLSALDDFTVSRYRQVLRMLHYFMFVTTMKKFNRARKPYELLDAENELCEMEYQRMQKFKDLELRVQATIGKPTISPFCIQQGNGDKLNISDRLELCEDALKNLEHKVKMINDLGNLILETLQHPGQKPTPQFLTAPKANEHPQSLRRAREDLKRRVLFKDYSFG